MTNNLLLNQKVLQGESQRPEFIWLHYQHHSEHSWRTNLKLEMLRQKETLIPKHMKSHNDLTNIKLGMVGRSTME